MTEAKEFQCPNCGSPLNLQGEAIKIKCAYCGTLVIVPEELRPRKAPTPVSFSTPMYTMPQYNDDELSKQISTVGKVATGIAVSTMVAPIVVTVLIFCVVGAFVAFILFSVNSTVKTALNAADPSALQTSIAATLLPVIAEIPVDEPTDVPPTDEPTETATPTPTAVPVSTPFSKVLFHDDFTTKKGWSVYSDSYYTLAYVKGGYRIFIDTDGGQTTWIDKINYKDINVAVDVKYVDGPQDGRFGVTCRVKENSGFYGFESSPDGWYAIEKYTSGDNKSTSEILAEGNMDTSNLSKDAIFHLRGDCVGHTLTLYINDQALLQVTDSSYASGGIGLSAGTGPSGDLGVDVLFSNYSVTGK